MRGAVHVFLLRLIRRAFTGGVDHHRGELQQFAALPGSLHRRIDVTQVGAVGPGPGVAVVRLHAHAAQ